MTSRVQKGNTVFRPVAKARSRAPTVPPSQSSSGPSELQTAPEAIVAPRPLALPAVPLPIPSTTVPGRELLKQPLRSHPEPISFMPQSFHDQQMLAPGLNFSIASSPHSPPVLINTSNLPPTLVTAEPSTTEPATPINIPPRQNDGSPVAFPRPFHIPPRPPIMTSGHNQHQPDSVVFRPPVPATTELINALVPTPHFDNFPQPLASSYTSQQQVEGDGVERPKRKRKTSKVSSNGEEEGPSRSISPHQRRSRGPSLPPFDPNADPGEDIDPTVVTMATLCSDTGQGRVSSKAAEILSNHAMWKARNKERRARMRALMEATKYGRQVGEEVEQTERPSSSLDEVGGANGANPATASKTPGAGTDEETGIDYSQQMETSRYNVQVRIGPNGETIIDEDSLVVDRAENEDTSNYIHVVESDHTKFVNSGTYGKRYRGSRWGAEETELFYNALSQYGENYELIAYVLPGRDRKSCKNKFKTEDKKNHARINYCLNNRIPVDMKTLERMTGKDFSGPVPQIRPLPPPVIHPGPSQEQECSEDRTQTGTTKPSRKRSHSRTAGLSEEGVVIVGDVDSVPS